MNQPQEFPFPLIPVATQGITPANASCIIYRYQAQDDSRAERRQQQLTGRHAAREACLLQAETQSARTLDKALYQNLQIATGPLGEPVFPTELRGSIAHTVGCGGAIVASAVEFQSIGIDIELANRTIPPAVQQRILHPSEASWGTYSPPSGVACYALAIFTAKEAIIKTLSPLLRRPVVLDEVRVDWSPRLASHDDGSIVGQFSLQPTTPIAAQVHGTITGTTAIIGQLLVSIATLSHPREA